MHTADTPEPAEPAAVPCPWCGTPTVPNRGVPGGGTRGLMAGGKLVGELCPRCTAESYEIEAEARQWAISAGPDY